MRNYALGFILGAVLTALIILIFFRPKPPLSQDEITQPSEALCLELYPHLASPDEVLAPPCPTLEELLEAQREAERREPPAPDVILPPPDYASSLPPTLETGHPGEVLIAWDEVIGAKRYRVSVYGPDSEVVTNRTTTHLRMYLQRIPYTGGEAPFVDYTVRLSTQNANGEWGPEGPRRSLRVLQVHGHIQLSKEQTADPLMAPEIEAIVIED